MESTRRPWSHALYLGLLAVTVALAAAAFSWAANSSASTSPSQGATPAVQQETTPVQDTQTTPMPPDGGRGGPGEDCPEHDGDGSGSGSAPQSTAPQSTDTSSDVEL
jgi:hypothetical protein